MEIGFIGLGNLGTPMASRIMEAGHRLHVWARRRDRVAGLIEAGAVWEPSACRLAETCEIVGLCVYDHKAVEEVVFGDGGLGSGEGDRLRLIVDHTTSHPRRTQEQAARLLSLKGIGWVDAPVSGGASGAQRGTLAVMAGGSEVNLRLAEAEMSCFAGRITHMGPVGSGQTTKLLNQIILAATASGLSEAAIVASSLGIEVGKLVDAFSGGLADSGLGRLLLPQMATGRVKGRTDLMLKDLGMLHEIGLDAGLPMRTTKRAIADYTAAEDLGLGDQGLGALMHLLVHPLDSGNP